MTYKSFIVVTEGDLEVPVAASMLKSLKVKFEPACFYNKAGRGNFWRDIEKYNDAVKRFDFILGIADLENEPCTLKFIAKKFPKKKHEAFVLRLAEKMIESWLLADREAFARFLDVSIDLVPLRPDTENNPKALVVQLARKSKDARMVRALVPPEGMHVQVGRGYSSEMSNFASKFWSAQRARKHSPSLDRALKALERVISN